MSGKQRLTGRLAAKALAGLREITDILERHEIRYCLDGGTLLGIVREGRLLPWDNDLDLFMPSTEVDKLSRIKWPLWLKGYKVKEVFMRESHGPMQKGDLRIFKIKTRKLFFRKQKLLLDIIVKYPDESHYYWSVGGDEVVNKRVPRVYYDKLDAVQFNGKSYPIPGRVEEYLTCRYGDWQTPVKEWDFKRDDQAAVKS